MEKNNIKLKISRVIEMISLADLSKVPKFPRSGTSFFCENPKRPPETIKI